MVSPSHFCEGVGPARLWMGVVEYCVGVEKWEIPPAIIIRLCQARIFNYKLVRRVPGFSQVTHANRLHLWL